MFSGTTLFIVVALIALVNGVPSHSQFDGGWLSMGPDQESPTHKPDNATEQKSSDRFIDFSQIAADASKQQPCTEGDQCSFLERFEWKNNKRWYAADGYANGPAFDSWWSNKNAIFDTRKKKMKIKVANQEGHKKPFVSGHVQSKKWHRYGCYEVRMRPANQEGLITTFFSLTGKFDHAPGQPKSHNEVDIEFVYRRRIRGIGLQANYFTDGKGGNEHLIPLSFDPTRKFHNYAFKWTSKRIEWYVDGSKVYTATKNTPKTAKGPHKIMMNLWPVSGIYSNWGGDYVWRGPKISAWSAVRFTRGEDCAIANRF